MTDDAARTHPLLDVTNAADDEEVTEPGRKGWDWIIPLLLVVSFVFLPVIIHALAKGVVGGWLILGALAIVSLVAGWRDGVRFRSSWTLPILTGAAFYTTMQLYYNDGTWIYLPIFVVLVWGASKYGESMPGSRRKREGF